MYINPFVAGILFTICAEVLACMVYVGVKQVKKGK